MPGRFFAPDLDSGNDAVRLSPDETHHLADVLRLSTGAEVHVFDGRGGEWLARVRAVERSGATLSIVGPASPAAPEPAIAVTLAQAVLRADRMDDVVRDATMLGVARISPLVIARRASSGRSFDATRAVERWRRVAIASCKQCGRARLPEIRPPVPLGAFVAAASPGVRLALVEPRTGVGATPSVDDLRETARLQGAAVIVGPEGGWSPDELHRLAEAGWRAWSLGAITLRADAVAVAALSVLYYAWRQPADAV